MQQAVTGWTGKLTNRYRRPVNAARRLTLAIGMTTPGESPPLQIGYVRPITR